jgi:hypothetical protein
MFQPQQLCFKVLRVMSGVHRMERSDCAFCSLGRHNSPVWLSLAFCSSVAIPNTVAGPIFMNDGVDKYLGVGRAFWRDYICSPMCLCVFIWLLFQFQRSYKKNSDTLLITLQLRG